MEFTPKMISTESIKRRCWVKKNTFGFWIYSYIKRDIICPQPTLGSYCSNKTFIICEVSRDKETLFWFFCEGIV